MACKVYKSYNSLFDAYIIFFIEVNGFERNEQASTADKSRA
jgi:hypothetical protein